MATIIKTYRESVPARRFIGIRYTDDDRQDGMFGHLWQEWHEEGRFQLLMENLADHSDTADQAQMAGHDHELSDDDTAFIGLMRWQADDPFQYWIGLFAPEGTDVPNGFESHDFPASDLGVCWIHGHEPEIYKREQDCMQALEDEDYTIASAPDGATWFFERYASPRFTNPDEEGKVILDICYYIQ